MSKVRYKEFEAADGVRVQVSFKSGPGGSLVVSEVKSLNPDHVAIIDGDQFAVVRTKDHRISALWRQEKPAVVAENPLDSLKSLPTDQINSQLDGKIYRSFHPRISPSVKTAATRPVQPEPSPPDSPILHPKRFKMPYSFELAVSQADYEGAINGALNTGELRPIILRGGGYTFSMNALRSVDGSVHFSDLVMLDSEGLSLRLASSGPITGERALKIFDGSKYLGHVFLTGDQRAVFLDARQILSLGFGEEILDGELALGHLLTLDNPALKRAQEFLPSRAGMSSQELRQSIEFELSYRRSRLLPSNVFLSANIPIKKVKGTSAFYTLVDKEKTLEAKVSMGTRGNKIVIGSNTLYLKGNDRRTYILLAAQEQSVENFPLGYIAKGKDGRHYVVAYIQDETASADNSRLVLTNNPNSIRRAVAVGLRNGERESRALRFLSRFFNDLANDEQGSTPLNHDAYKGPSSPKAFLSYANFGVALGAGFLVDSFFKNDAESHTQAEVGFWRHAATALATSLTSSPFSNGRITWKQSLPSYARGFIIGSPFDAFIIKAGLGSSMTGNALSYIVNRVADHALDALAHRNPFAGAAMAGAGLALFMGSTMFSYYNETCQNDARQSAMA